MTVVYPVTPPRTVPPPSKRLKLDTSALPQRPPSSSSTSRISYSPPLIPTPSPLAISQDASQPQQNASLMPSIELLILTPPSTPVKRPKRVRTQSFSKLVGTLKRSPAILDMTRLTQEAFENEQASRVTDSPRSIEDGRTPDLVMSSASSTSSWSLSSPQDLQGESSERDGHYRDGSMSPVTQYLTLKYGSFEERTCLDDPWRLYNNRWDRQKDEKVGLGISL